MFKVLQVRKVLFHAGQMIEYGSNVVGGVTPGKGGQKHLEKPVFNTVKDAVDATGADVTIIFVPPAFAADAIMEAADAGIKVIVTITEGIPVKDMMKAKPYAISRGAKLVGSKLSGSDHAGRGKSRNHARFCLQKRKSWNSI